MMMIKSLTTILLAFAFATTATFARKSADTTTTTNTEAEHRNLAVDCNYYDLVMETETANMLLYVGIDEFSNYFCNKVTEVGMLIPAMENPYDFFTGEYASCKANMFIKGIHGLEDQGKGLTKDDDGSMDMDNCKSVIADLGKALLDAIGESDEQSESKEGGYRRKLPFAALARVGGAAARRFGPSILRSVAGNRLSGSSSDSFLGVASSVIDRIGIF